MRWRVWRPARRRSRCAPRRERLRRDLARRVGDDDLAPHVRVVPAGEALVAEGSRPLAMRTAWLLFAAGALVLALAGLAAGVLLLLRGEQRHRELAVRRSMGAGGGALLRVLSAEAAMLGALGVAAGVGLALVWQRALVALLPADFPLLPAAVENALGPRLLAAAAAAGLFVALLAGAVPAWRARRRDPAQSLKGEISVDAAGWRLPLRSGLVVVQVALSVVLLSAAGLLLRTLWQASRVDSGISTRGVVLASLDLSRQGYDEARGARFWEELLARLEAAPGVEAAALGKQVPVSGAGMYVTMQPEGYEIPDGERAGTSFNVVSPGYFRALGVPLVAGRSFTGGDRAGAPLVAVVNEAFVRQYWRGKSALGRSIGDVGPRGEAVSVVGVARDVRAYSLREEASPTLFVPLQQSYLSGLTAVVKGRSGTRAVAGDVARDGGGARRGHAAVRSEDVGDACGQQPRARAGAGSAARRSWWAGAVVDAARHLRGAGVRHGAAGARARRAARAWRRRAQLGELGVAARARLDGRRGRARRRRGGGAQPEPWLVALWRWGAGSVGVCVAGGAAVGGGGERGLAAGAAGGIRGSDAGAAVGRELIDDRQRETRDARRETPDRERAGGCGRGRGPPLRGTLAFSGIQARMARSPPGAGSRAAAFDQPTRAPSGGPAATAPGPARTRLQLSVRGPRSARVALSARML